MLDFGYYNMDNMVGMKEFPDKYFDIAVVDPQYGINAPNMAMGSNRSRKDGGYPGISTAEKLKKGRLNSGGEKLKNRALNTMDCSWDNERPKPEYFKELFRISKNQIIFGYNYFTDMLPPCRGFIVWDKCQPWENFSQAELAWTSYDIPAKIFKYSNTGGANTEEKIHPTQKPIQLYAWIYSKFGEVGMKMLDTHVGSGTNLRAAHDAGIRFVGFEKSGFYYAKSKEKLDAHMAQMNFYDIPEVMP